MYPYLGMVVVAGGNGRGGEAKCSRFLNNVNNDLSSSQILDSPEISSFSLCSLTRSLCLGLSRASWCAGAPRPGAPPGRESRRESFPYPGGHLVRLDFFLRIFRLKKQQHLVSLTCSGSACGVMGALERSCVAPSSSRLRSMLVEPL